MMDEDQESEVMESDDEIDGSYEYKHVKDVLNYTCKFPVELSRKLIGKKGQNIKLIGLKTGVYIKLVPDPDSSSFELCNIRGTENQIHHALTMISGDNRFATVDLSPVDVTPHLKRFECRSDLYNAVAGTSREQEDSPLKTGLLSSIDAVFEQNRKEDEKRKQTLKTKREAELVHSRYLKNTSSPQDLSEAKFVMDQWADKHCSRKMKAVSKEAADRRSQTNKPYSRPTDRSQSNVSKMNSRFGTSLYSSVQNTDFGSITRTVYNDEAAQCSASASTEYIPPNSSNFSTPKHFKSETPLKNRKYSLIELLSDEESIINISDTCPLDNSDFISLHERNSDSVVIQVRGSSEKKKSSKKKKLKRPSVEQENQEEEEFVKCPVMNCNCKFREKAEFQLHMDNFEHSPNNPWFDYVSGQEEEENGFMCPECCKVFGYSDLCLQHMRDRKYNHLLPPLPVAGYLCGHCFCVFPSQESCTLHITERKHFRQIFQFSDDIGKVYHNGVPISKNFFQDYYEKCMSSDFHIKCCDCELLIKSPRELQQHYDETKLMHHCMALTDVQKSDIFESYLCTNVCVSCNAVINDPNQNSGYHHCNDSLGGKIIVDGCKSFRKLILGQCIRLELEKVGNSNVVDRKSNMIKPKPIEVDPFSVDKKSYVLEPKPKEVDPYLVDRKSNVLEPKPIDLNPYPVDRKSNVVEPEPMEVDPYPLKCHNQVTDNEPGPSKRRRCISESFRINSTADKDDEVYPGPSYLKTMVNIIFLDLDNWRSFFQKLPYRLPPKTFVWGFYGGKTQWREPFQCGPFQYQKRQKRFHLHEKCGSTKDAADFAICLTVGKMDMCLPSTVHFTILSGDKGFCEIERQMKSSKRKAVVIDPHHAIKMSNEVLYTMIVSVGDN